MREKNENKRNLTPSMYYENDSSSKAAKAGKSLASKNTIDQLHDRPPLIAKNRNAEATKPKKVTAEDNDENYEPADTDLSDSSESAEVDLPASSSSKELAKANNIQSKRKSVVPRAACHDYFVAIQVGGVLYDKCNVLSNGMTCTTKFIKHGSTTRMNEHLRKHHNKTEFSYTAKNKKEISDQVKLLVHFIVSSSSPFSIVENEYFQSLMSSKLIPFNLPSRKVLKEMLISVYDEIFNDIKNKLAKVNYLAATTDGWSANFQKKSYLGLTIHFLDECFESNSISLGIHQLNSHDAALTAKLLENKLNLFGIFNKINYIAVDNASVMKQTCLKLKKESVDCVNHLLNLIVKRFFNAKMIQQDEDDELLEDIFEDEIDDWNELNESDDDESYATEYVNALKSVGKILIKVKKIVILFNKSIQLRDSLVARTKLTLINDIKVRWNYTLLMIERYTALYDDVLTIITNSPKHSKNYAKYFLNSEEISILGYLQQLLKPFYTVTLILGGENSSTIDMVLNSILYIRHKLDQLNFQLEIGLSLKKLLIESFNFYVEKYKLLDNIIYMSASLLSPVQICQNRRKRKVLAVLFLKFNINIRFLYNSSKLI